ncbi:MAG: hypothetical protein ACC657_17855, partial [Thiohalomonadales bacterium]
MVFFHNNKIRNLRILFITLILLHLQACGGGGGSGTAAPVNDRTPNEFFFAEELNASLSQVYVSNSIVVDGIDTATTISIIGGDYAIDGAAFTNANGNITNGQSIQVRQTSSNSTSSKTDVTLTIGGVNGIYSVTTFDRDIDPDDFTFNAQTDVFLNAVVISNAITIAGLNGDSPIKVSNGDYYVNGVLNTPATVKNGDIVKAQVTASNLYNTPNTATVSIGNISRVFTVTTVAGSNLVIASPAIIDLIESPTAT